MKDETKHLLFWAWAYCDFEDKSTEYMIQFMQDVAKVNHDTVISFIQKTSDLERKQWYEDNPDWTEDVHKYT